MARTNAGSNAGPSIPMDPRSEGFDPRDFLLERYAHREAGPSRLLAAYYTLKPLIPRPLQLAIRRGYAKRQAQRAFPRWPVEPILVEYQHEQLRRRLRESGAQSVPIVNFWPHGKRFCSIITHDVEGPDGIRNIPRVLEVERRHGIVSAWNFCAEHYEIPPGTFDIVREAGCEVGLHGIKHDGKLFRDRRCFEAELPKIHRYLNRWGAVGFRSPATHRNPDWMPELGCVYDGSFPDTDPFEPQAGGCCSIFPYTIGEMVELPMTLVQDHTLREILGDESISCWTHKGDWVIRNHGLVHLLVHPDYLLSDDRLETYSSFLGWLAGQDGNWHALPKDVAHWWKGFAGLRCQPTSGGDAELLGEPTDGATVAWVREDEQGNIAFDLTRRVKG